MNSKNAGGIMISFALGGLIGAGMALLFAPRSGEKTRRKILTAIDDAKEGINDYAGRVKSRFV
ncbi:MAG: YtxH domain-containing protein [Nitrospiraceae bacterium]|nr:YtxH domain-containing protein [Nitrospiraceae bacterium]